MIFELMSRGEIAELPNDGSRDVTLLMPYGRLLKGELRAGIESWYLKKQSDEDVWEEVFLYEDQSKIFNFNKGQKVLLSVEVVKKLRTALLSQFPPPGEHPNAAAIVRGIAEDLEISDEEKFIFDETYGLEILAHDKETAAAYWGVRFAIARGEHEIIPRIKLWYRAARRHAFSDSAIRVWFSLTQTPDNEMMEALAAQGFPPDDVKRIAAQGASPVVLFCRGGYLVLASYGDANSAPLFREWAYFPPDVWNDLRERKRMTLRDLLTLAWGVKNVQEALRQCALYGYKY